jgi:hypothetical protein
MLPHRIIRTTRNVRYKSWRKYRSHIFCSINCSRKSYRLWDNAPKYGRARQATVDNTAHAHCTLDTQGYKHILRICNTCCFSIVTMITRTRHIVPLYLHCHVLLLTTGVVVVFWAVTRCSVVNGCHCCAGNCCSHPTHTSVAGSGWNMPLNQTTRLHPPSRQVWYGCDNLEAHRQSVIVMKVTSAGNFATGSSSMRMQNFRLTNPTFDS